MSEAHTATILMIVMITIGVGAVGVFYQHESNLGASAQAIKKGLQTETSGSASGQPDMKVVQVVGSQVANGGYQYVHFQVQYDGEGNLSLNDTFIQIRTDKSEADLQYRNGTQQRNINNGFYTQ